MGCQNSGITNTFLKSAGMVSGGMAVNSLCLLALMPLAFSDSVSVGVYRFALILVDHATRYNWAFGLKTLSSSCILLAL
jgi:hypothetical protein